MLEERFQEGVLLASGGEFERAADLFAECLAAEPGYLPYVEAFLANLSRRPSLPGSARPAEQAPDLPLNKALAEGNWAEVLRLGPRQLLAQGRHLPTLLAMAEASASLGHDEAERCYLHSALESAPDEVEPHRRLARLHARKQKLDEALNHWQRVAALRPDDAEAARTISRLAIEVSRRRAGLAPRGVELDEPMKPAERVKDSPKASNLPRTSAKPPGGGLPRSLPGVKLTPIQQLEVAIRDQPSNAEFYLKLVPLYLEKDRQYDAERLLERGKEATGDGRVRQLWEDVVLLRLERKVEFAHREAERNDTPEARAELTQLRAERDRFAIDAFTARCQREPDNLALRYELGRKLQQAGKLKAACEQFREALDDPSWRADAAYELGQCLAQFFDYPEALKHYRLAADSAIGPEQVDRKMEALYRAAELASRVKLRRPAKRYLEELLTIDPKYRDAAGMLEKMPQVVV